MLDLGHLAQIDGVTIQEIFGTTASDTTAITLPRNKNFLYIVAIGPGGSGGLGGAGTAGSSRFGGDGGGSGAVMVALYARAMIPDVIFITFKPNTSVQIYPSTTNTFLLALAKTGGNGGTGATGGAAGGTTSVTADAILPGMALGYSTIAGAVGVIAGTGAGGGVSMTGRVVSPGAAGGGGNVPASTAGGGITGITSLFPTLTGPAANTAGQNGVFIRYPRMFSGGTGAGSSDATTGLPGGDGSYGCGGGGGSSGTSAGAAGKGGPGYVLLISF